METKFTEKGFLNQHLKVQSYIPDTSGGLPAYNP